MTGIPFLSMAQEIPPAPVQSSADMHNKSVAIVASKFNLEYTDALVSSCVNELSSLAPDLQIKIVRVPGSFEVPMAIQALANSSENFDCYIALGVILKGSTAHDMHVGSAVGHGLMEIALSTGTPVINEVLHVHNLDQARERCMGDKLNRGVEAARTAYEMVALLSEL